MKTSNIALLVNLLATYMRRRVLSQGPLRDPAFRAGVAVLAILTLAALTWIAFLFLRPVLGEGGNLEFMVRVASIATVYWTILIFLFVRVLFSRSSDMMKFTWQLPLTNRQRSAALAIFEALIVLGFTGMVFIPLGFSVVLLAGFSGLVFILEGIAFPATCVFIGLLIVNNSVTRILNGLKLSRIATLVSFVVCAGVLGAFSTVSQPLSKAMSDDFLAQRDGYHVTDNFVAFGQLHGSMAAIGAFIVIAAPAATLAWLMIPHTYTTARKFFGVKIPGSWTSTELGWYILAWGRRADTWLAILVTYAVAIVMTFKSPSIVSFSIGILTTQALYHFSATRPLRRLPGTDPSAGWTLLLLLSSQVLGLVMVSLPVLAIALTTGTTVTQILLTLGSCISGVILLNLLGILFPQDRDNPFSAVASYLVCLLIIAILVLVFGIIDLPVAASIALLAILHAAGLFYSHLGIQTAIRKARYA